MAVPKPMLTEFGIHYRLESYVKDFSILKPYFLLKSSFWGKFWQGKDKIKINLWKRMVLTMEYIWIFQKLEADNLNRPYHTILYRGWLYADMQQFFITTTRKKEKGEASAFWAHGFPNHRAKFPNLWKGMVLTLPVWICTRLPHRRFLAHTWGWTGVGAVSYTWACPYSFSSGSLWQWHRTRRRIPDGSMGRSGP